MEVTEAPNDASTPQRQQQHSMAIGVAGSKDGFDAGDGDEFGGGVGGKSRSPLMESSSHSIPLLRPSKKPKTTHDGGYRSVCQQAVWEFKRKNGHLQLKPAPLTQWLWGSGEDGSRPASVHSGGGAPLTPPSFHGLSPTSWTLAAHGAPGDDSLKGGRLDSGADSSGAQRASSGGAQLLKTVMQAGGNLDGAGGGRAGSVYTDYLSSNGGSFVFGLKCEQPNMAEVLGLLDPLDSIIDQYISDGSAPSRTVLILTMMRLEEGRRFLW